MACEDTRRTGALLRAHGIATATTSYFEHNERGKGERVLAALRAGHDALDSGALLGAATDHDVRAKLLH